MLRVIDLDIDGSLSADTGVFEVALVEFPAIEQNFIYFNKQKFETYNDYPQEASNNACRVLEWIDKYGRDEVDGMTEVGLARANQLCSRENISEDTIARMSAFNRHRGNSDISPEFKGTPWKDKGYVAWLGWGGDAGVDWAQRKLQQIKKPLNQSKENFIEVKPNETKDEYIGRCVAYHIKNENMEPDQSYAICISKYETMAEVGPRGGIKESPKAPKGSTPNPNPKGEGSAKGDASNTRSAEVSKEMEETLQNKSDDFNERYKDKLGYGTTVGMLKAVYQRGAGAYNSSHSPVVRSKEQWALARVNAFLYIVKNGRPEKKGYIQDNDLLPKGHPKEGKTEEKDSLQLLGEKISYDYDGTASTKRGKDKIHNDLMLGYDIYIISARNSKDEIVADLKDLAIPLSKIYAVGSNQNKIQTIKRLGITKHYDNNPEVIKQLGTLGEKFDYDTSNLPSYQNTPVSGDTELIKPILTPVLFEEDCNCGKIEFEQIGYVDGFPVFSTKEEAEQYGENEYGCNGSHEHTDEDGNIVYMACETHPKEFEEYFNQIQPEEQELINLLQNLKETDHQKFEAITGDLRGASLAELKRRNHKQPTPYYLYKRVLTGSPDRDFCMSIEGRYFRRFEIDLLKDTNTEFGHNREPYSKFLYKGGPNCIHAFYQVIAQGNKITEIGPAPGQAGIPPKRMKNNGYYDKDTKRKSEVAYIISQQNSKNWEFYDWNNHDLTPSGYLNGFPVFQDSLLAQSAADIIGCGCYGSTMFMGKEQFQACLTTETKMEKQLFKAEEDKKMIYTPLMIPNILIPRMDEVSNERYFVRFTPEVIEKIQQKFMIEQRLKDTNYEHTDKKFSDIVMVESWIVSGDQDKAYSLGFTKKQIPKGTWMGGYKVLDTTEGNMIWRDYIKPGKVKGVSVEGDFLLNFSAQKSDEYLLEEIIKTINKIK